MSELVRKSIEEEFDIEPDEVEIETFREVIKKAKEIEDPNNILSSAIDKAGKFLDKIEEELAHGNVTARYIETAAQLINSIIQASNSIASVNSISFNDKIKYEQLTQNKRRLDQRDREIEIKELYYNKKLTDGHTQETNNNEKIIVTDRESIMKFLENKNNTKEQKD